MKMNYTTKDIVTIVVISVVNGLIGAGWGYIWNIAAAVPTIGGIFSAALTFIWFIGPLVSFYLIRKPGVAAATQLLSGIIAVLAGHPAGVVAYGWYVLEAIGAEAGFAIFAYKRVDIVAMSLAAFLQAINFAWSLFYFNLAQYGFNAWFWPWVFTFLTAWIAGPIAIPLGRAMSRTGLYTVGKAPS